MEDQDKGAEKVEFVKVACRLGSNLAIHRYGEVNEGNGFRPKLDAGYTLIGSSGVGGGVTDTEADFSEPGYTMIPRPWIEAWLEENKLAPVVSQGFVYIVGDKKPDEAKPEVA